MGLLQLLKSLFGQKYLNKIIGTRTNVAKPIRMDKNSPFKRYSNSAFDDPELIAEIEKKIDEYGSYALSNKNPQELANFEDNAKRLLAAKNKQTGTTPGMVESMKPKPEADIVDITTKQKVDDTGIMKLKTELGLPEGVEPGSVADKAIKESVQYKMDQQGVKKVLDKDYVPPKTTPIDEDEIADINLKEDIAKLTDREARAYSANIESFRRPIIRQMLLKDTRINLSDDVRKSLENKADLQRGADPEMDPLRLLNEYYDVNFDKLDELEEIRFTARNESEAADEFLKKGGLEPKKDLGDKLKDYDGDPDALAEGGRPGYAYGTGLKLLNLFGKQKTNAAKEVKRSIDNIFPTGDAKYDADVVVDEIMEHLDIDRDAVDGFDISDLYGKAYNALTKQRFDAKKLMESVNQKGKGVVTTADNIPQPTKTLKSIKDTGTIDISNDEIMGEFEAFMRRNDPEGMKPIDALVEKINLKGKKRTDNAEGGRIGFSAGGVKKIGMVGFQKLRDLIRNLAKERGIQGSDVLKLMNYKNLEPAIKSKFTKKDFDKFKLEVQESRMKQLENFRDMFESKVKFNQSIEQGKALDDGGTGMSDIFNYMDESFSKRSPVPRNVNEEDVLSMEQLIKNQTIKDDSRKLNAQGGLNYLMGL